MSGIEDDVIASFFKKLVEGTEVSDAVVDGLREAFQPGARPKPDQLVRLISDATGEAMA